MWGGRAYERAPIDGVDTKYSRLFRAETGAVIVNKIWARNGSVAVVPEELSGCYGSGEFQMFMPIRPRLDPRWMHWLTQTPSFWNQCDEKSRGTSGKNRIRPERFLKITISLPPLEEQRRIVARIEELAAQINEARIFRQQATEEAEGLLSSKVSHLFAEAAAKGWSVGKLGDYVEDDCYGTSEKASDDSSGIPILRMGNIQNGQLDLAELKYLHLFGKNRSRLLLKSGDILVNRTNSAELVGKCAVFDLDGEFSFASYLIRLRLDQRRADPRLVAAYINSPLGRVYMLSEKRQMTGQANVNSPKLKALPIALPRIFKQHQVAEALGIFQQNVISLEKIHAETTAELDALLPSILDKAFKGEL